MHTIPGLLLALILALVGQYLSELIGVSLLGLPKSPISAIMLAIILGIVVRNTLQLPAFLLPGIRFGLVHVLRLGIVLLGIRLSLGEVGLIGLQSLPVIAGSVVSALLIVTFIGVKAGLSARLGTLIAVGTSICGATAIVATAPAIAARDDEVVYSVACVTLFGLAAMLVYPFAAHYIFSADPFSVGLFLGTAVHETAQVAGAGLVYQEYYSSPEALNVATVTKLVRNLSMLLVIPLMSIAYHRQSDGSAAAPAWWRMIPLFVVGFAAMSLVRTLGDLFIPGLAWVDIGDWQRLIDLIKQLAELCLAVAMASVGLGTSIHDLKKTGPRPLAVGLLSALLVGAVSIILIGILS
jgi:uncharacterized integral membrane protein (TIGR00698 family)